ncbi:MAG: ABC transporter ATP-binding protein [Balneolaceae bacterium]|nr:MAG: ABC transporter ATP-binding protein [Balneolaceae bacterium]
MLNSLKKIYKLLPDGDFYKLAILFFMMITASFLAVLGIGTVPVFVSVVIDSERVLAMPGAGPILDGWGISTPQRLVVAGAALLILVYLLKNIYMIFFEYVNGKYMLNRKVMLQNKLFNAYMRSPYTYFIKRNSSELLRNVGSEVDRVINGTLKPCMLISLHSIMTIVIITGLFIVEPFITAVGIVLFGGMAWAFLKLTKNKVKLFGKESLVHRQGMNKAILQGLGGFKDAKVLHREPHFLKEYNYHASRHKFYDLWKGIINSMPVQLIELMALTGILFIAIVMVLQFRELNSIITVLALFGAAIVKLKPSIYQVISNANVLRYNAYSVEAIFDDLDYLESKQIHTLSLETVSEPMELRHSIELNGLEYSYPGTSTPAVKNVTITIPKNRAVAFVGPSGAGKTTLVDVILGLLQPQKGTLSVDGKNVFNDVRAWQKNIGYIPQFIYLLDESIRSNICFGIAEEDIDDNLLQTVIKTSQLSELIDSLEDGVNTVVGERGVRLSGGQRQRIGIARALYNNPQVLVMDEATSALDNITERYLVKAIEELRGDKTLIMIAHRLTTVQNCDTIYMMKDAEIIARGTYEELLASSAEFREMSLVDK